MESSPAGMESSPAGIAQVQDCAWGEVLLAAGYTWGRRLRSAGLVGGLRDIEWRAPVPSPWRRSRSGERGEGYFGVW